MGIAHNPVANIVFDLQEKRPQWRHQIVQRDGNDRGDGIASQKKSEAKAKQGLEAKQRSKAHEEADCHTPRNGVGSVLQIQKSFP